MKSDVKISVISPVYGCKRLLPGLYERLAKTLSTITDDFEIILVNDGCPQNSWETIVELCLRDSRLKGINLSRNFGQHHAITAGLDHAWGDWIVVMDCDLQDQPEEIPRLYQKALEGYDIVFGQRIERRDSLLKKLTSRIFRTIFGHLSGIKRDASQANFGIFSRKVVVNVNRYREQYRGFPAFVSLVGFRKTAIPTNHAKRTEGQSSYNFSRLMSLAVDGIIAHSSKPLKISIHFGFLISLISIFATAWLIFRYFYLGVPVAGWTSIMVAMFFLFGVLFALLGILGLYLSKVFDETKGRPLYIISETFNLPELPDDGANQHRLFRGLTDD